jgi:[ribosomal protein S5]-alanine N-acetyltransferase
MEEAVSTIRLILRKPEIHDHTAVYENWVREPEITKYLTWRPHKSPEETRSFIQQCIKDWENETRFPFVICLKSTKEVIGMIEFRIDKFKAEIGYVLCKKYWGQGYMTEALKKMLDLLLSQEKIYRVQAYCDIENTGSFRVMEKAGMKCEGILSRFAIHPNISDKPRDCYMFSKTG